MVGFENNLAQMIFKTRQCVLCENHVVTSKVKFTVRTYSLWIGFSVSCSCPALSFVVAPASDMVRYKNPGFPSVRTSHQGGILVKAPGGGISVLFHISFLVSTFSGTVTTYKISILSKLFIQWKDMHVRIETPTARRYHVQDFPLYEHRGQDQIRILWRLILNSEK